jgi:hypothetical protein
MVALIEELFDYKFGFRCVLAVCASRAIAEEWITRSGGNQMVLLDDGDTVPLYRISEFMIMNTVADINSVDF